MVLALALMSLLAAMDGGGGSAAYALALCMSTVPTLRGGLECGFVAWCGVYF
jgi:hypothetical protein